MLNLDNLVESSSNSESAGIGSCLNLYTCKINYIVILVATYMYIHKLRHTSVKSYADAVVQY